MKAETNPNTPESVHIVPMAATSTLSVIIDGREQLIPFCLIAAAPDLLAALEKLVEYNDACCRASGQFSTADAVGYRRNEAARAAIAKAKGA